MNRFFIFFILLSLIMICDESIGENHKIQFFTDNNESTVILIGQENILLRVIFDIRNCSNCSIEYSSCLFKSNLSVFIEGKIEPYMINDYQIPINQNIEPGNHSILLNITYYNETGKVIHEQNFQYLQLIKSIELKNVIYPINEQRKIRIDIITYTAFDEIQIDFNSEGNIGISPEGIVLNNVGEGTYSIYSDIYYISNRIGNQEIAFKIRAQNNTRYVEIFQNNSNINILWDNDNRDEDRESFYSLLLLFLLILTIFSYIYFKKSRYIKKS